MPGNPFDKARVRGVALSMLALFPSATATGVQADVGRAAAAVTAATNDADHELNELFRARTVASPQVLAGMRGGFVGTAGGQTLQLAFGIDQALFVNGQLVVTTRITVPNISQPAAAQVQNIVAPTPPTPPTVVAPTTPTIVVPTPPTIVAPTAPTPPTIVAPTPPTVVAPTPPTIAAPTAPTPPTVVTPTPPIVVVPSTVPTVTTVSAPTHGVVVTTVSAPTPPSQSSAAQVASTQAAPSQSSAAANATTAPAVVASPAGITITTVQTPTGVSNLVQIGPGNAFAMNTAQLPSGVFNVIQNSLDNQTIRQTTNLQLSANSIGVMRALNFGAALQRQLLSSTR
jgi:hypothetical protein